MGVLIKLALNQLPCLEYHFTTLEKMRRSIEAADFIEWAEYSGNLYGTRSVRTVGKGLQSLGGEEIWLGTRLVFKW